jgi:hypothetical protein
MTRFTYLLDYVDKQESTTYSNLRDAVEALLKSSTETVGSPFIYVIGRKNLFLYNVLTRERYKYSYIQ